MKKKAIIIDSDGFFWPDDISADYMSVERKGISIEQEDQSLHSLFEQYYLGFRSSMLVCEDQINDEKDAIEVNEALRSYREGCLGSASRYLKKHIEGKLTLPVDFMWITRMAIVEELKDDYPEIENIQLRLSMKPRISARTVDKKIIIFPALARTVINHCNLVIINESLRCIDNWDKKPESGLDGQIISRFVLPYLLFCHDDFSVQNLPIIGAYSKDAAHFAFQFTNLQIMFIFAHEYAHILLGHFEQNVLSHTSDVDIEGEADSLALKVVLGHVKKYSAHYGSSAELDVLAAVRWLFKYQLIEETIGALIRGESIDYLGSSYEERRGRFQAELFEQTELKGASLLDNIGFIAIVELQSVLYEFGADLINSMINALKKRVKQEEWNHGGKK